MKRAEMQSALRPFVFCLMRLFKARASQYLCG